MKKRFTEEQIVWILKEADDGMSRKDVCRKHNVSEQTFYRWKKRYADMEVSEVKRLKELELENAALKALLAEQDLDIRMQKDINEENGGPYRPASNGEVFAQRVGDQRTQSLCCCIVSGD